MYRGTRTFALILFFITVALATVTPAMSRQKTGPVIPALDEITGPVTIRGDKVTYWRGEDSYRVEGNVRVEAEEFNLTCDRLEVDNITGRVEASGNVKVKSRDSEFTCQRFSFDRNTREGTVVEATLYIAQNHATVGAEKIEKIGPGTYLIRNATYTTCKCPEGEKPDWAVKAARIKFKEEGWARAEGATFRIKDTPVIYLPVAGWPMKTERQTGFLIPKVGYSSRNGFEFALPFYVATARWWDFTVTEKYLEKRGVKQELEVRWVRRKGRAGELDGYYLDDRKEEENRWAGVYEGRIPLFTGLEWRQDVRHISDNEYIRDFRGDNLVEERSRSLESRMILERPFSWGEMSLFTRYVDDLQGDDIGDRYGYEDRDDLVYHQLPRAAARTSLISIPYLPLQAGIRTTVDNFYRHSPEHGSPYEDNRWVRHGDVYPFLTATLRPFSGAYFSPEVGWRGTGWETDDTEYHRSLAVARAEGGLRFYRHWRGRYKHTVEPRAGYIVTDDVHSNMPPPTDFTDTMTDLQAFEFNLDQHLLMRKAGERGKLRIHDLAQFEVTQEYTPEDGEFRTLRGQLRVRAREWVTFDADTSYELNEGEYNYAMAGGVFRDKRGDTASVSYRYQGEDDWQFLKNRAKVQLTPAVALTYFNFINITEGRFVDHGGGALLTPASDCWSLRGEVSYHTDPEEVRYRLQVNLYGLGSAGPR